VRAVRKGRPFLPVPTDLAGGGWLPESNEVTTQEGAMLGFKVGLWDYITLAALMLLVFAGVAFMVWLAGLPGRIALKRNHPEAEAVQLMGFAGFLAAVPWINAFIWAFKPTDVVDIRRWPAQEALATQEENARLRGTAAAPAAAPATRPGPAGPVSS